MNDPGLLDQLAIRTVVDNWALFRDAGRWDEFESVWHPDGWMTATWFQGPFKDFIAASRAGFERGAQVSHFLGGFSCEIRGDRAIAQTKMKIEQRADLEGVEVDVTCTGRFYDFFDRTQGYWSIVRRQPIYESDRIDFVDATRTCRLDPHKLAAFPASYRHLAYLQEANGMRVIRGLPGLRGAATELLYAEGAAWLNGSAKPGRRSSEAVTGEH